MPSPNFFPDYKSSILGLSNDLSFVSEFYLDGVQNSQRVFLKTCCMISITQHCTLEARNLLSRIVIVLLKKHSNSTLPGVFIQHDDYLYSMLQTP